MTKIFIFEKENLICGFQVKGHSGYAEEGHDIVCSSISTATQMAVVGLKQVIGLDIELQIKDGFMFVHLKKEDLKNRSAQDLLMTMKETLTEIAKEFEKYVKLEVKNDVY